MKKHAIKADATMIKNVTNRIKTEHKKYKQCKTMSIIIEQFCKDGRLQCYLKSKASKIRLDDMAHNIISGIFDPLPCIVFQEDRHHLRAPYISPFASFILSIFFAICRYA